MARSPRRWRRKVLIGLGVVVVLIIIGIIVGPWIAGAVLPSRVERALAPHIDGSVDVERTRLSWFGAQRIGPVVVRDAEGTEAAQLTARVDRGLLGLLTGGGSLGTITLAGDVTVIVAEDGSTNIDRIFGLGDDEGGAGPGGPPAGDPVRVPKGLKGTLLVDGVRVTVIDPSLEEEIGPGIEAALIGVTAKADFGVDRDVTIDIDLQASCGSLEAPAANDLGVIELDAVISNLTDADGVLQLPDASLRGTMQADDIPLAVADSMAHANGWLFDSLGASADATIEFDLSSTDADVEVALEGEAIAADVDLAWHDGRLRLASPGTVRWRDPGLVQRLRELASDGTADRVNFTSLPELTVALTMLDIGLDPAAPGLVNIDGAVLDVGISVSRIEATVPGVNGDPTPIHLAPREIHLTSADLASSLSVNAHPADTGEDAGAGAIETNLVLSGLANPNGTPHIGPPQSIEGSVVLRSYPTAVFQPLFDLVDLSQVVGSTFDLDIRASSELERAESTIDARLTSTNLGLDASMLVNQQRIATRDEGVTATMKDASMVLARLLADAPIDASSPGRITVSVPSLVLDLEAMGAGARLGALTAEASISMTASSGTLEDKAWSISPVSLLASLEASVGTAQLAIDELVIDGTSLGGLTADVIAEQGAEPAWLPSRVTIDANAPRISSDVLALVPGLEAFDMQQDVGESIDLTLQASGDPSDLMHTLAGTVRTRSRELTTRASVRVADGAIRADEGGIVVDLRHAGRVASKLMPADSPYDVHGGGWVRVRSNDVSIPLTDGVPDIGAARGHVTLEGGNFGMTLTDFENRQVGAESISMQLTVGDTVAADLIIKGEADQSGYTISGDVSDKRSLAALLADPAGMQPDGALKIDGLPTSLVAAFLPEGKGDAAFILLGASMSASLEAVPSDAGIEIDLTASGAHATSMVKARLESETLVVSEATADVNVPQGRTRRLIQLLVPAIDEHVRPGTALSAHVDVQPWRVALADLASAGALNATATVDCTMNMQMNEASAFQTTGATLEASIPIGAMAGGAPAELRVTLDADAQQERGPLAKLDAELAMSIGSDDDPIHLTLDAQNVDVSWFDALLDEEGLLTGAVGPTATVSIRSDAIADGTQFTIELEALRMKTQQPAVIALKDDRIELVKPLKAWWRVNPDWFDQRVNAERTLVTLTSPPTLELSVDTLVVSRGEGLFKPGVFDAQAIVRSQELDVSFGDGVQATYTNFYVQVEDGDRPDELKVTMTLDENDRRALDVTGIVDDIADESGVPSMAQATVSFDASVPQGRSDVLDALAGRDGRLKELLGPTVDLTVDADGFTKAGGTLKITADSPRTQLSVDGVVGYGRFVASKPVELTVHEITPALGATLMNGLPLGTIEKRPEDGPMTVVATGLQVPVDGDLSRLNGDVVINVGTARFQTSSAFSKILSLAHQRDSGQVGRRLAPLTLHMRDGVLSYDRYSVPLGEFQIETQAKSIDLVNKRLNIITWIPIGALGDEAAGQFNTGLGSALGRALPTFDKLTRVPWRTSGTFGHTTTLPDVTLFVENTGAQLLRPDILIRDRLQEIFGRKKKEGEDK